MTVRYTSSVGFIRSGINAEETTPNTRISASKPTEYRVVNSVAKPYIKSFCSICFEITTKRKRAEL